MIFRPNVVPYIINAGNGMMLVMSLVNDAYPLSKVPSSNRIEHVLSTEILDPCLRNYCCMKISIVTVKQFGTNLDKFGFDELCEYLVLCRAIHVVP